MKSLMSFGLFSFLVACGTTSSIIVAPDGKPAAAIECNHIAQCWQRAGEYCPSGYNIVNGQDEHGWKVAATPNFTNAGSTHKTSMMIVCKDGIPPKLPDNSGAAEGKDYTYPPPNFQR